jgi:hypothetical protein
VTTMTEQRTPDAELLAAADAVVERWHLRDWKAPHTAEYIARLSAAVGAVKRRASVSTPQQSAQRASVETGEFIRLMNLYVELSTAPNEKFDVSIAHIAWKNLIAHINAWGSAGSDATDAQEDIRVARHAVFNLKEFRAGRTTFPGEALGILEKALDRLAATPSPAPQGEQA